MAKQGTPATTSPAAQQPSSSTNKPVNEHPKTAIDEWKDTLTLLLGIAGGLVAWLALRQSHHSYRDRLKHDRRTATVEFFSSQRDFFLQEMAKDKQILDLTRDRRRTAISNALKDSGIQDASASQIARTYDDGCYFPALLTFDSQVSARLEQLIGNTKIFLGSQGYTTAIPLLNMLEELAQACNAAIFDTFTADRLYGGLIVSLYNEHLALIRRIRRLRDKRFYDQLDSLISSLLELRMWVYDLASPRIAWTLLAHGNRSFTLLCKRHFENFYELEISLKRSGLGNMADELRPICGNFPYIVQRSDPATWPQQEQLAKLFSLVYNSTNGVWPVLGKDTSNYSSEDVTQECLQWIKEDWLQLSHVVSIWSKGGMFKHRELIGFVAIENLDPDSDDHHKHWDGDFRAAISTLGKSDLEIETTLNEIGVPIAGQPSRWKLDATRIAIVKRMAVHPDYQRQGCGRILLREALHWVHFTAKKVALLNVIADSPATQKAIRLYDEQGGEFLGAHQDYGCVDGHKMYLYCF